MALTVKQKRDVQRASAEIEAGQNVRMDGHGSRIGSAENRLGGHDTAFSAAGVRLDNADSRIATNTTRLDGHDTDVSRHNAQIGNAVTTLDSHGNRLGGHDTDISRHNAQIGNLLTTADSHDTRIINANNNANSRISRDANENVGGVKSFDQVRVLVDGGGAYSRIRARADGTLYGQLV